MRQSLALVLTGTFWAMVLSAAEEQPHSGRAPRIGVVDVSRIFREYAKAEELSRQMKARYEAKQKEMEERGKELLKQEAALKFDTRDPENVELFKDRQRIALAKFEHERQTKEFYRELDKARLENMRLILGEIREAIKRYGAEHSYDIILKLQEEDGEAETVRELVRDFSLTAVLYMARSVDLTEPVLTLLNQAHAKGSSFIEKRGR